MSKTTELSFSLKINLGNFETMDVSQNISLSDNDDEKMCFAELVTSVQKKAKAVIGMLGRETDSLMYKQLNKILGNTQQEKQQIQINQTQQTSQQVFNQKTETSSEFLDNPTLEDFCSSFEVNPQENNQDNLLFGLESALNSNIPEL